MLVGTQVIVPGTHVIMQGYIHTAHVIVTHLAALGHQVPQAIWTARTHGIQTFEINAKFLERERERERE